MEKQDFDRLKLKQISESLQNKTLVPVEELGGRIKNIREALGMTQKELAKRLKVNQAVISRIEDNIASSSLKTIKKIVKALKCDFSIALSSEVPLEEIIRKKAQEVARKLLSRTHANMAMEKQAPSNSAYEFQLNQLIDKLSQDPGPELWEK